MKDYTTKALVPAVTSRNPPSIFWSRIDGLVYAGTVPNDHVPLAACVVALAGSLLGACADTDSARGMPIGTVVVGYDDSYDAERIRAHLTDLRAREGRSPAQPFMVAQQHLTDAKRWIADGIEPERAVENSMAGSAGDGERTVAWWCLPVDDPGVLRFPAALRHARTLNLAIAVVKRAGTDSPRYYVLLATYSLHEARSPFGSSLGYPRFWNRPNTPPVGSRTTLKVPSGMTTQSRRT